MLSASPRLQCFTISRSKAIKLASQEEYNTERFKLAELNMTNYKKEISNLVKNKAALQADLAKQENKIQVLLKWVCLTKISYLILF